MSHPLRGASHCVLAVRRIFLRGIHIFPTGSYGLPVTLKFALILSAGFRISLKENQENFNQANQQADQGF
jgi:hypothetical protein